MAEQKRRRIEVMTDDAYIEGLSDRSLAELNRLRSEADEVENEVSFERRLCQARIDILNAELDHRAGKAGDVISRLPEILAKELGGGGGAEALPSRAPDLSVPDNAGIARRRVEEIAGEQTLARLSDMDQNEIQVIIDQLKEHEKSLSGQRRKLHDVVDKIQAVIVDRYAKGEADPDSILPR
jgi:hypothetical protein